MAQGSRPSKRPRTAPDDVAQDPLKHHEEFWLDDGNVVLVARNIGFRVYRGLLVTQSTVFADMFASSSPHSDETIDGCPVIHVSDSPEDLVHLLRVLLPTTQRRFRREKDTPERTFDEVFAVITLAHKYHIEDVRRQALCSLREYTFNDNFAVWKGVRKEIISVDDACAIGAFNLARLLDVPEMLPIALYKCLSLGPSLLDGWTRGDGSVEYLSQDDIKRCFAASNELAADCVTLTYSVYHPHASSGCNHASHCKATLRQMLADIMQHAPGAVSHASEVMTPCMFNFGDYDLCAPCEQALMERDVSGRDMIWNGFPHLFHIVAKDWGKGV
ncbi:hypothetical protein LXA43DRAFT_992370 [Ganoderma leucocontextum]|nr:hypothetical protein LXA43DRAFT_992370 [Ganoderma leucocontextum]